MPSTFCAQCRAPRNTRGTAVRHEDTQHEPPRMMETRNYHCEACGGFIYAETVAITRLPDGKATA